MRGSRIALVTASLLLPVGGLACPCVDTQVVRVANDERRLIVTVSETSQVMITAALYELLLEQIRPIYADWLDDWQVSFYTTRRAAEADQNTPADQHVADYDRARGTLTLWPRIELRRQEISLEIR